MKTYVHVWQYITEFFLGREWLQTKVVEKMKTQFYVQLHSSTIVLCMRELWKLGRIGQTTDDNIIRRMFCVLYN